MTVFRYSFITYSSTVFNLPVFMHTQFFFLISLRFFIALFLQVAEKVVSAFSHQLFVTGFVHGDPHPGNVFVRPSPQGDAEIVLLDHGLYMHRSERAHV